MSIRLEIDTNGKIVAFCESPKEAADFAKQFSSVNGSTNGARAVQPCDQPSFARAVRGLRDAQKAVLRQVMAADWAISDTELRTALGLTPPAFGGLLAGISKALTTAGVDPKRVIDRRTTTDGTIQYYTREINEVREGLT